MIQGNEDAVSIVSNTTKNSDETIPNIPVMYLQDTGSTGRRPEEPTGLWMDRYEGSGLDRTSYENGFCGLSSPIIPVHDDSQILCQLPNNSSLPGNNNDDNTDGAVDEDCSEMSEIIISVKTMVNTDYRVKSYDNGLVHSPEETQYETPLDVSQSLLPVSLECANLKTKQGEMQHKMQDTVKPKQIHANKTVDIKTPNRATYGTRSSSKSQTGSRENQCQSADMEGQLSRSFSQSSKLNAKDDICTEKLNLRIGKLLTSIEKAPARQQEVIKTTVEHCMMKLQDNLDKRLSNLKGELDSLSFSRIRRLVVLIQTNLTRVMTFYKTSEVKGSSADRHDSQPSMARMHQQHMKNLLAIVQRQKSLVANFKDFDRGKLFPSKCDNQQDYGIHQTDLSQTGVSAYTGLPANITPSSRNKAKTRRERSRSEHSKREQEPGSLQTFKKMKTDPVTSVVKPGSKHSGTSSNKSNASINSLKSSGKSQLSECMKTNTPETNSFEFTELSVDRSGAVDTIVSTESGSTLLPISKNVFPDSVQTKAEAMWLSMLHINTEGGTAEPVDSRDVRENKSSFTVHVDSQGTDDTYKDRDKEVGVLGVSKPTNEDYTIDDKTKSYSVSDTAPGHSDDDHLARVQSNNDHSVTVQSNKDHSVTVQPNNDHSVTVQSNEDHSDNDHQAMIQFNNDDVVIDDYFSDNESVDILTATKVIHVISDLDKSIPCHEDSKNLQAATSRYKDNWTNNSMLSLKRDPSHLSGCSEGISSLERPFEKNEIIMNAYSKNGHSGGTGGAINMEGSDEGTDIPQQGSSNKTVVNKENSITKLLKSSIEIPTPIRVKLDLPVDDGVGSGQVSPTSTCISSDIFMVKTQELDRRQKQRLLEGKNQPPHGNKDIHHVHNVTGSSVRKFVQPGSVASGGILQHKQGNLIPIQNWQQRSGNVTPAKNMQEKPINMTPVKKLQQNQRNVTPAKNGQVIPGVQTFSHNTQFNFEALKLESQDSKPDIKKPPTPYYASQNSCQTTQVILPKPVPQPAQTSAQHNRSQTVSQQRDTTDGKHKSASLPFWRELIAGGTIKPGPRVLSVMIKSTSHYASITRDGKIQDSRGIVFNTPVKWITSLSSGRTVKKLKAFQQVMYRGKPIIAYCGPEKDKDSSTGTSRENKNPISIQSFTVQDRKDEDTQTDESVNTCTPGPTDKYLNTLLSNSRVHLLTKKDFVSYADLPSNFWTEDFSCVKLSKSVWDSITLW